MSNIVNQPGAREFAQKRRELSPDTEAAFQTFSKAVFADGALSGKAKQIIAVAVAHVTQCPYCIKGAYEGGATAWRFARRADGGDLGRSRDAGWRGLRSFSSLNRGDGKSRGGAERVSGRDYFFAISGNRLRVSPERLLTAKMLRQSQFCVFW
jgi:AhpD family alkylhydroperoxidase